MNEEQSVATVAPAPAYGEETSGWRPFGDSLPTTLTKIANGHRKMIDAQSGDAAVSNDRLYERIEPEEVDE